MRFIPPLKCGRLIRRYKRFLADIELPDGSSVTIHCPNSGSMRGCSEPGSPVAYSRSDNPARKYPHTLEMVQSDSVWIGVNTSRTNHLVREAIESGTITELAGYDNLKQEVKVSSGSRLDLLLSGKDHDTYVEIKNCSLVEAGQARFPDAVTARGTKHLHELAELVQQGHRGVILFLVQRDDATSFTPAADIDPEYSSTFAQVLARGVEALAYRARLSPEGIDVLDPLPIST